MPAFLVLPAHLPVAELERRYRQARDPVARSHWQIVWLLSSGHRAPEVAAVTGYSVNWVREIAGRYRRDGPAGLGDRRHHNPGGPALLDAAGRAALRDALGGPPPEGGVWTGRQVARWLSTYLARPVSPQRGWEYLTQAGFTPQQPRPTAVQVDPAAQAAFKKGGSRPRSTP
jgi:transposase